MYFVYVKIYYKPPRSEVIYRHDFKTKDEAEEFFSKKTLELRNVPPSEIYFPSWLTMVYKNDSIEFSSEYETEYVIKSWSV